MTGYCLITAIHMIKRWCGHSSVDGDDSEERISDEEMMAAPGMDEGTVGVCSGGEKTVPRFKAE